MRLHNALRHSTPIACSPHVTTRAGHDEDERLRGNFRRISGKMCAMDYKKPRKAVTALERCFRCTKRWCLCHHYEEYLS